MNGDADVAWRLVAVVAWEAIAAEQDGNRVGRELCVALVGKHRGCVCRENEVLES